VLFDVYERHVLRDLDTGLIPEASVTAGITADLGLRRAQPGRAAHRPRLPVHA
jgi:hypothetical protein